MNRLSMAVGLALVIALPASAQMYKWVDSSGVSHYSDKPPPSNVKTEKLRTPAQPLIAPAASEPKVGTDKGAAKTGPKSLAEQDQAFRKRQAEGAKEQEEQAKKDAQSRDRAENCRRAKAALANLELGGRQTRINEKGERVFLSEQEITQATAQMQQEAATACK